jgi:hypothetical protein
VGAVSSMAVPKFEVPTIYKAYFSGPNFREYPDNFYGLKNGTDFLHFRILKFLLILNPFINPRYWTYEP